MIGVVNGVWNLEYFGMKRVGTILFYLGGCVWIAYAIAKYILGWNVTLRQFLPYHLVAVIPGVALKHGYPLYVRLSRRWRQGG
ncbi:MAG TPA: hypothetical protein HPP94_10240 [Desulfuromonadales bacterium]|nr:hypothetical protein [Desulfuromonadales bacterium]